MAAGAGLAAVMIFPPAFLADVPEHFRQVVRVLGLFLFLLSLFALIWLTWFRKSTHPESRAIERLSNEHFKERLLSYTNEVRIFVANFGQNERALSVQEWAVGTRYANPQTTTREQKAERHQLWLSARQQDRQRQGQFDTEFLVRYRPTLIALHNDLRRRLGQFGELETTNPRTTILRNPVVTPYLLSLTLDYLEQLARSLS